MSQPSTSDDESSAVVEEPSAAPVRDGSVQDVPESTDEVEAKVETEDDDSADEDEDATEDGGKPARRRRARTVRTFPACSFLEALPIAEAIQRFAAGQRVRRLTLFEDLKRSPESGAGRQLVTNSSAYGLTTGSSTAEWLELTSAGKLASGDVSLGRARLAARLQLAIADIAPFNALYAQFSNNRLPTGSVLRDFVLSEKLVNADTADECVQTFIANARDLNLLRTYAGAERLLTFEILLEEAESGQPAASFEDVDDARGEGAAMQAAPTIRVTIPPQSPAQVIADASDLSNVCFLITPIGSIESEQRQHADLMLGSIIEPALASLNLRLVRADKISTPGLITSQVIDHIVRAPLVIADLSFGNPNVFYELALRHACRKPAIQIIRKGDPLPFDVNQFRTVEMDMSSIYTLVPQIEVHRAEIARQSRAALAAGADPQSPLSLFYPDFWQQFSQ